MSDRTSPQPSATPPPDRYQIERLNTLYQIIDAPAAGGLTSRLAAVARRLLGRVLSRQQEFNAALVDHLNRDAAVGAEAHQASLNTIEWVAAAISRLDDVHRQTESLMARERRNDASVAALVAQHDELRAAVAVLQQAAQDLKRKVSTLTAGPSTAGAGMAAAVGQPAAGASAVNAAAATPPGSQFDDLDSYKYVGFEDQFRGSPDEIRRRVADYLPIFVGSGDQGLGVDASGVLDVGCGRGEFLDLLREHGIAARGVDVNAAMVEVCRSQGLDVVQADALTYLRALPDGSLGGLFAAQVVEHLEPRYLTQFLDAAFDKLRPGAPLVLETINPACWYAFFESYIRDLTHVRPVHPDTLKYLLIATGFQEVTINYRAPYPDSGKLQPLAAGNRAPADGLDDLLETMNANVEKINRLLFTYLDYAAVGRRG